MVTLGLFSLVRNFFALVYSWQKWCCKKPGLTPRRACAEHPPISWIPAAGRGNLAKWRQIDHITLVLTYFHSDFSQVRPSAEKRQEIIVQHKVNGQQQPAIQLSISYHCTGRFNRSFRARSCQIGPWSLTGLLIHVSGLAQEPINIGTLDYSPNLMIIALTSTQPLIHFTIYKTSLWPLSC